MTRPWSDAADAFAMVAAASPAAVSGGPVFYSDRRWDSGGYHCPADEAFR